MSKRLIKIILESVVCMIKIAMVYKIIVNYGYIIGIITTFIAINAYRYFMLKFFNLTSIETDAAQIGYKENERYNMGLVVSLENIQPEKLKELLIERGIKKMLRLRSKLVYKFFNYWWAEVPLKEAISVVKIIKPIDELKMEEFINNEVNTYVEIFSTLSYEIQIVPFKNSNKGFILFKMDHVMSDGLGITSLLNCIADNYSDQLFHPLFRNRHYTLASKIYDWALFPFYGPYHSLRVLFADRTSTIYKNIDVKGTGKSIITHTKLYDMSDFENIKKKYSISFNDITLSVVSLALTRISRKRNYTTKAMNFVIPVGRKGMPHSIEQVQLSNKAQGFMISLPLIDNFEIGCKHMSKTVNKDLKISPLCSAGFNTQHILGEFVPQELFNWFSCECLKTLDMIFSNVPGPTDYLFYGGSKVTELTPYVTAGRAKVFMGVVTYRKQFKFMISHDTILEVHPNEVVQAIEKIIEELMEQK